MNDNAGELVTWARFHAGSPGGAAECEMQDVGVPRKTDLCGLEAGQRTSGVQALKIECAEPFAIVERLEKRYFPRVTTTLTFSSKFPT